MVFSLERDGNDGKLDGGGTGGGSVVDGGEGVMPSPSLQMDHKCRA